MVVVFFYFLLVSVNLFLYQISSFLITNFNFARTGACLAYSETFSYQGIFNICNMHMGPPSLPHLLKKARHTIYSPRMRGTVIFPGHLAAHLFQYLIIFHVSFSFSFMKIYNVQIMKLVWESNVVSSKLPTNAHNGRLAFPMAFTHHCETLP